MERVIYFAILIVVITTTSYAQRRTTYTGTAVIYGTGLSTRTITRPFTLILNGQSSNNDIARFIEARQSGGQDALRRQLDRSDLGRFSFGSTVGVPVGAVMVDQAGGDTRIRVIFSRDIGFGELRRGLRSVDYPFGYLELRVDNNGHGDGTIIPRAQIRILGNNTFEVEDFGTFPGRLMGVRARGGSR
jgi:hypothetical protein